MENIIEVNQSNIETEHICCAIGNDPVNRRRADDKKAWMDQRRGDGHRFIKADLRGKVFAEFEPAENAWAPIRADGYQFIQCLWASGRYQGKGYGRELIDRVKTEVLAADPHCRGLVIISSNKKRPFMVAPGFLHAMGFSPVDHGEPWFDLYALKFDVDLSAIAATSSVALSVFACLSNFLACFSRSAIFCSSLKALNAFTACSLVS
jgi:GNAT superfamily N-acetyltransferase